MRTVPEESDPPPDDLGRKGAAGQPHTPRASRMAFLRSRGLGAELVPPLSLVSDDLGIYYDPNARKPAGTADCPARPVAARSGPTRAEALVARITALGLSKYNLGGAQPELPKGHRILVPGQVEDDASIRLGAGEICSNLALLERVRAENPDAVILYKPHPDVEAGLREGAVPDEALSGLADAVLHQTDPAALLAEVAGSLDHDLASGV